MLDLVEYLAAFATGPLVLALHRAARAARGPPRPRLSESSSSSSPTPRRRSSSRRSVSRTPTCGGASPSTSEGNPLFAEQLAAMMADAAAAATRSSSPHRSTHSWPPGSTASSPPSGGRSSAPRSSARSSGRAPSSASPSRADQPLVMSRLLSLVRKGLVQPSRAEVPGEDAYRFRHSLICDETYAGIPKAVRAELHERFARWLQAQGREGRGLRRARRDHRLPPRAGPPLPHGARPGTTTKRRRWRSRPAASWRPRDDGRLRGRTCPPQS